MVMKSLVLSYICISEYYSYHPQRQSSEDFIIFITSESLPSLLLLSSPSFCCPNEEQEDANEVEEEKEGEEKEGREVYRG